MHAYLQGRLKSGMLDDLEFERMDHEESLRERFKLVQTLG